MGNAWMAFVGGAPHSSWKLTPITRAWSVVATAAAKAHLAVVLGTERVVDDALALS
jgi:hypothetical protein